MRCPSCEKFVSYDDSTEPEVDAQLSAGHIGGSVRIVLTCADCGEELKEGNFDLDADVSVPGEHEGEDHDLDVTVASSELTSAQRGRGRRAPTFYGYSVELEIGCSCGWRAEEEVTLTDDMQASEMDELV